MAGSKLTPWSFLDNDGAAKDKNTNYLVAITAYDDAARKQPTIIANLPQNFTMDLTATYEPSIAQGISGMLNSRLNAVATAMGAQIVTQAMTAQLWQGASALSFSLPLLFHVHESEEDVLRPLQQLYSLVLPGELGGDGIFTAPGPRLSKELAGLAVSQAASGSAEALSTVGGTALDALGLKGFKENVKETWSKLQSSNDSSSSVPNAEAYKTRKKGEPSPLISRITNNISLRIGNYMNFDSVVITNIGQTHHVQPLESGTMSMVEVTVGFTTFFTPTKNDIDRIFNRRSWALEDVNNAFANGASTQGYENF